MGRGGFTELSPMLRHLHFLMLPVAVALTVQVKAQNIGINVNGTAPAASALLGIDASGLPSPGKRGLLIPRIALTSRTVAAPVVTAAASLVIYNTATAGSAPYNVLPGYYYWNGISEWLRMFSGNDAWSTTGNNATTAGTNFLGTTDANDLVVKTNNMERRIGVSPSLAQLEVSSGAGDAIHAYSGNDFSQAPGAVESMLSSERQHPYLPRVGSAARNLGSRDQ